MAIIWEVCDVSLGQRSSRAFNDAGFIKNTANVLIDKLYDKSYTDAKVMLTDQGLTVYGIAKPDLDKVLNELQQTSVDVHSHKLTYDITVRKPTADEAVKIAERYIETLESKLSSCTARASDLEKVNSKLQEDVHSANNAKDEVKGKYVLLEQKYADLQKSLDSVILQKSSSVECKTVILEPQISQKQLFELLECSSSMIRTLDAYVEAMHQHNVDIVNYEMPRQMGMKEWMKKEFGIYEDDIGKLAVKLAKRGEGPEVLDDIMQAMVEYANYCQDFVSLQLFSDVHIKIPIFAANDGKETHYYIPRGANWGELSKSMRDNLVKVVKEYVKDVDVTKTELAYKITIKAQDVAKYISDSLEKYQSTLWDNLGVLVRVMDVNLIKKG